HWRNAAAPAEDRGRRLGIKWRISRNRHSEAESAEIGGDAEAAIGVRIGHRYRLRDTGGPVAGLHQVLLRQYSVIVDDPLCLARLLHGSGGGQQPLGLEAFAARC